MSRKPAKVPAGKRAAPPVGARNPQLNGQVRKLLSKHYRAKHGVK